MRGVLARGQRLVFRGEPLAGPATLSDATAYVNDIQARISEARRFLTHRLPDEVGNSFGQTMALYHRNLVLSPRLAWEVKRGWPTWRLGCYCSENDMSMYVALMPRVRE